MRSENNDRLNNLFFELFVVPFVRLLVVADAVTYVMAFARWLLTEHSSFWHSFKELLWALCPLLNITYVWDWWVQILRIGWLATQYLMHTINGMTPTNAQIAAAIGNEILDIRSWITVLIVSLTIAGFLVAKTRAEKRKTKNRANL